MSKFATIVLSLFILCGCQLKTAPNERVAVGTMELCEFVNPRLGAQIAKVVDTAFSRDDVGSVVLTLHPTATIYANMPGVDTEAGAPFNATLETYHSYYGGFASDSAFLGRMKACVMIGKLLCYVVTEEGVQTIIRPTGKKHTVRHTFDEPEMVCICAEEDRRLLIGNDGSLQRVYSRFAFVPYGPIDSILVEFPDTYPEFPGGKMH